MTEILGSFGLERRTLFARDGVAIRAVAERYSGAAGGRSERAGVGTGVVGIGNTIVPLHDATPIGAEVDGPLVQERADAGREPAVAGGTAPAL